MNSSLRALIAGLTSLALLSTAACAQLPTSSDIKNGPNVESGLETDYLYYSPSGPGEDATQEEIILGFLNAGTGPQNDYEVAKSYLAESFQSDWDPNQQVLIQDGRPTLTLLENNTAVVVIPIAARINERGQYQTMPLGSSESIEIELVEQDGQWRVQSAPNLTTVIRPVFDVIFKAYAVYFFDNQLRHLVPDVRWFPTRASTSTRLVSALLGGPSEWLEDSVKTAFPAGTKLSLSTVTVADGVASVDLTSRALKASARGRQLMQVQVKETLIQLNSIYTVQVTVARSALEASTWDFGAVATQIVNPVAMLTDGLFHIDNAGSLEVGGSNAALKRVSGTDFGLNTSEELIAISNSEGVYLSALGDLIQPPKLLISGSDFLSPVLDTDGYTWVVPKNSEQPISVFNSEGQPVPFSAGWLAGLDRQSFSISSEGSRIVVAAGSNNAGSVYVAGINRDDTGNPVSFGSPIIPAGSVAAQSVTWLDNIRIGILQKTIDGFSQPLIVMVGGGTKTLPTIRDGRRIVGSGQPSGVYVLDKNRGVFQFRSSTWNFIKGDVTALHFPGN
jgi:hypothetical protein